MSSKNKCVELLDTSLEDKMQGFKSFLAEAKNTHMEHLEDMMFNEGKVGAEKAIKFMYDLHAMLGSKSKSAVATTVKWDGAPAIIAGIDPTDGQFFVGAKGVFAQTPKTIKSLSDLDKFGYDGGLRTKLQVAFESLQGIITKGVYQGDIMFTKGDVKVEKIDGESYFTIHPNTIVYAFPVNSPLGRKISNASIGIVWHTTYTGSSLADMKASFGKAIASGLPDDPKVWTADAMYSDLSGSASFTEDETKQLYAMLKKAEATLARVNSNVLEVIAGDKQTRDLVKSYNNSFVRQGIPYPKVRQHVAGLFRHIRGWWKKEEDKRKSDAGKAKVKASKNTMIQNVFSNPNNLIPVFELFNELTVAKMMIVNKMNKAGSVAKTFVKTAKGFKTTDPEGYVAINNTGAVKIVDRWEFSFNNFSPTVLKGWQK